MRFFLFLFFTIVGLFFSVPFGIMASENVSMEGRIVDAEGNSVEGAEVYLYRSKNVKKPADFMSTKTGTDGLYKVILSVGTYWSVAIFRKSGKTFGPLEKGDRHSGEPIKLELGESLEQDFEIIDLREAARKVQKRNEDLFKLSGRLVDATGDPVAESYALAGKTKKFKNIPRYISAWTDVSGKYSLFLPTGTYYLGGALLFPPGPDSSLEKEITLNKDNEGVDIVVKSE